MIIFVNNNIIRFKENKYKHTSNTKSMKNININDENKDPLLVDNNLIENKFLKKS